MVDIVSINSSLNQPQALTRNKTVIQQLCEQFVRQYEHTDTICGSELQADELRPLLGSLSMDGTSTSVIPIELELIMVKTLKILLRKMANRLSLGKAGVTSILQILQRQLTQRNLTSLCEMCNTVLNACYNGVNVQHFIELDAMRLLLACLRSQEYKLQSSALGAIQAFCYVAPGRQSIRQNRQYIDKISEFLSSEDSTVRARAVGTVHNLSVDIVSLSMIRDTNCIPILVNLLRDDSVDICHEAAGTLQNLSREPESREFLLSTNAVSYLSDLLFSSDTNCQVVAIGTILNILGPSTSDESRVALQELLIDGLVIGSVRSCLFDT
eukprot:gene4728-6633_t